MEEARSGGLRLVMNDDLDAWREAQQVIERSKGFEEALIERQLQELDDSVVGTSAAELARLREEPEL